MYTYDMYRLVDVSREQLLERLRARVKRRDDPPVVGGRRADLASGERLFFVAESAEVMAGLMPVLQAGAEAGHTMVLVVPEPFKDPAGEMWDYLPAPLKPRVKILPIPVGEHPAG